METIPHSLTVIIGIHRSGTTIITSILEKLGVYVGYNNGTDFFILSWSMLHAVTAADFENI